MGNRSAVPVNDIQPLGRCCVVGSSGPAFLVSSPGSFQRCLAIPLRQTAVAARQAAVAAKMHVRPTRPAVVRNGDHEDDGFDRGAPAEQLGADAVQPTAGPAKRTGRRSRRSRKRFDTWRAKQRVSSFKLSEALVEEAARIAASTPGLQIPLVREESDTLRGGRDYDTSNPALQDSLHQKVRGGPRDLAPVTPPCHTLTRAMLSDSAVLSWTSRTCSAAGGLGIPPLALAAWQAGAALGKPSAGPLEHKVCAECGSQEELRGCDGCHRTLCPWCLGRCNLCGLALCLPCFGSHIWNCHRPPATGGGGAAAGGLAGPPRPPRASRGPGQRGAGQARLHPAMARGAGARGVRLPRCGHLPVPVCRC